MTKNLFIFCLILPLIFINFKKNYKIRVNEKGKVKALYIDSNLKKKNSLDSGETTIKIINADILGHSEEPCITFYNQPGTCVLDILSGNVMLEIDNTLIYSDSIQINKNNKTIESFSNTKIMDNGCVIMSKKLLYSGSSKKVYLYENVKVYNNQDTLYTNELIYDKHQQSFEFKKGGKIKSNTTVVNSINGIYNKNNNVSILKNNVTISDTNFTIHTDSIKISKSGEQHYIINFISPTQINLAQGQKIFTDSGNYNLHTKNLKLYNYSKIIDSNKITTAEKIYFNGEDNKGKYMNNCVMYDSSADLTLKADYIEFDNRESVFFAKQNCVASIVSKNKIDTFYLKADTLTSEKKSKNEHNNFKNKIANKLHTSDSINSALLTKNIVPSKKNKKQSKKNELKNFKKQNDSSKKIDTSALVIDSINKKTPKPVDSSVSVVNNDTTKHIFIIAYNNVKIFNDSIQAVCDSMVFVGYDSTLIMYKNPLVWINIKNQIKADSVKLFFSNQKIDSALFCDNAISIGHLKDSMFNQTISSNIIFKFNGDSVSNISFRKNVETIYYIENEKKELQGASKIKSGYMMVYVKENKVDKISYIENISGITYPLHKLRKKDAFLKSFIWQDSIRPKSKYEFIPTNSKVQFPSKKDFHIKSSFSYKE